MKSGTKIKVYSNVEIVDFTVNYKGNGAWVWFINNIWPIQLSLLQIKLRVGTAEIL